MISSSSGGSDAAKIVMRMAFKPVLFGASKRGQCCCVGTTPGETGLKGHFSLGECFVVCEIGESCSPAAWAALRCFWKRGARRPETDWSHGPDTPQSTCTDPQSGLAVGWFVVGLKGGSLPLRSENAALSGFESRQLHHKAPLGPEWAALKKHRSRLDTLNLNERVRRGPAWDGQPTYQGTKRKSVIFGAVGAYCGGVNGPLKSPAFDRCCSSIRLMGNSKQPGDHATPALAETCLKETECN